ncbi:hypothetical protein Tco_1374986 [Tanacetum coccineum]
MSNHFHDIFHHGRLTVASDVHICNCQPSHPTSPRCLYNIIISKSKTLPLSILLASKSIEAHRVKSTTSSLTAIVGHFPVRSCINSNHRKSRHQLLMAAKGGKKARPRAAPAAIFSRVDQSNGVLPGPLFPVS